MVDMPQNPTKANVYRVGKPKWLPNFRMNNCRFKSLKLLPSQDFGLSIYSFNRNSKFSVTKEIEKYWPNIISVRETCEDQLILNRETLIIKGLKKLNHPKNIEF